MTISVLLIVVAIAFASTNLASSFVPVKGNTFRTPRPLFGTIRFSAQANAVLRIPTSVTDEDKSLSKFLSTPASDAVLLGSKGTSTCSRIDTATGGGGELWECRQESVRWFGMSLIPIFVNQIDKTPDQNTIVVSIIDAKTEVEQGGGLGNTLASAMRRCKFEGRNAITWKEQHDGSNAAGGGCSYDLAGNLILTLIINLPPFLPLPPGFNSIGSKIVQRTCTERLNALLGEVVNAYLLWTISHE
jgi:hypothetical protein